MHHHPRRLVTPQPQNTLQTYGADAILLAGYLPDGAKPDRQREMAVLKHSPGSDRHLVSATTAEPAVASHSPSFGCRAARTTPSPGQRNAARFSMACFFAGKPLLQLKQRLGIILFHNTKHYAWGRWRQIDSQKNKSHRDQRVKSAGVGATFQCGRSRMRSSLLSTSRIAINRPVS